MNEKDWERLDTWAHGTKPATIIYHDVICALLDLHERLKAIELSLIHVVPILDEIEEFDNRLKSLENCLRAEGHWADRNEKDIVAVEERLEKLEKMLPITMDALNREKDMMERLERLEKKGGR